MPTLELVSELAEEYKLDNSKYAALCSSYDGYTPAERQLSPAQVEKTRALDSYDERSIAAALFQISNEVALHFYFDLDDLQIGFGD